MTENTLVTLFNSCDQLEKISMVGTSVCAVPEPKNLYIQLNLSGCPLLSPSNEYLANKPLGKFYKGMFIIVGIASCLTRGSSMFILGVLGLVEWQSNFDCLMENWSSGLTSRCDVILLT